jgi:phosphate transport system substrate-binding protein
MKYRVRAGLIAAVLALSIALSMIPAASATAKTVTMSGSTSIAPLATKLAKAFVKKKKGTKFVILQGGSDIGITDVSRGRVTIGMSSRNPKAADPGGIVFNKFARDGVCVVTNNSNRIPSLSLNLVQGIFSGQIRNWGQVPGAGASGSIHLIVRTAASGTQDAFQNIFMGETLGVPASAQTKASNGLLTQAVGADPQAIGYASFAFTGGLWAAPYSGVPCTLRNAKSGQYGGVRNFFFVTRGPAKGVAKKFLAFARKSKRAKKIVASEWVPLR